MSAPRRLSRPRSSSSPVLEPNVQLRLGTQIKEAIASTTEGIHDENKAHARRFLAKSDLEEILNPKALEQLFRELLSEDAGNGPATTLVKLDSAAASGTDMHSTNIDNVIETFVEKTIESNTPRRALLALFLYQRRTELLFIFVGWLNSDQIDYPSDASMPLSEKNLCDLDIPFECHDFILETQSMFTPVTIRKLQHHTFTTRDRLPYFGAQVQIKNGSSGVVWNTKIAPGHWEVKTSDDRYISENPESAMVVVLKTFKESKGMRTTQEASEDFAIERQILDDLRQCNISHRMLMLDWGSITIEDEESHPISHSLIFELATFSLEAFLEDSRCAEIYTTKSLLLSRLVDIVEALECLHDNLKTLHLDIKPDNILVFEKGSSRSDNENRDENELIWKLSDFGLARKKDAAQRTDHRVHPSYYSSQPSTLPATRPAGIYQAPEIQERNSSQAGRGSDVWSMGCVTIMVLAFLKDGPQEVSRLTHLLRVNFLNGGGTESLFYVRSDSYSWKDIDHFVYDYLTDFIPATGDVPGTDPQLKAAVHPYIINWSNELYHSYYYRPEQQVMKQALSVVFRHVLLIDRQERIHASGLREELSHVRDQWKSQVETPRDQHNPGQAANFQLDDGPVVKENNPNSGEGIQDSFDKNQTLQQPLNRQEQAEATLRVENVLYDQDEGRYAHQQRSGENQEVNPHPALCLAVKNDEAEAVHAELIKDCNQVKKPCSEPNCQIYPIHMALRNNAYQALDVLLENSDHTVTNIRCPNCGDRTPIEEACIGSGNREALRCFLRHHEKFNVTEEMYNDCMGGLGLEAGKFLKNLYQKPDSPPKNSWKKIIRKVI